MTKPPRRSPIKRTIDEDELIASQIRLSPGKSPKKFLQVGIVTCSLDHVTLIDETIRTKERSRLTMSLIKSYSLFQRLTFIPLVPGKDTPPVPGTLVLTKINFSRRQRPADGPFRGVCGRDQTVKGGRV